MVEEGVPSLDKVGTTSPVCPSTAVAARSASLVQFKASCQASAVGAFWTGVCGSELVDSLRSTGSISMRYTVGAAS